ncbi:alpha/beta fold family hydrolase [Oleiphilus messinensis]|uniref:Alpha/beta fold family hydrolase n=2 Tax=Oleiphilus messinensis TaxID=141451 RepID=A0A1Y0IHK7_9GAMM|nr:alpha/beta fold family hydrolase [Oleiphilus messinensis]ATW63161.1 esterase [uncultured bacterium]
MKYKFIPIQNIEVFYREAGERKNPTIVLLHGYPSSSHMFREVMPILAEKYHVIAPDYPGFGYTEAPNMDEFEYSFDNLASVVDEWLQALEVDRYFLVVQDYGAPIGFRIASTHPEKVQGLIIQNGNAYTDGLTDAWASIRDYWRDKTTENAAVLRQLCTPDFIKHMYINGVCETKKLSPDAWTLDSSFLSDETRVKIQIELFYDYHSNVEKYSQWHEYFKKHQPPALVIWGINDMFFSQKGAECYQNDLEDIEYNFYDTGHFALEEYGADMSAKILRFADRVTQANLAD